MTKPQNTHQMNQQAPNKVKPAIRWPGGKTRLLEYILPLIPQHTCYCEPFAGGLAVLLAKPRSALEVINDANSDLVNFYRCVRFHREAVLDELEFALNSRREFGDYIQQPGLTDIQRAARWFFRNKNCFGGSDLNSFGTSALSASAAHSSRSGCWDKIRALNARLDKVVIEHGDWRRVIEIYDRPSTFFFIDPPYTGCRIKAYDSWSLENVRGLRRVLDALQGGWLLTLNDAPEIRDIFQDCQIEPVKRARGIDAKTAKAYGELIIRPPAGGGDD